MNDELREFYDTWFNGSSIDMLDCPRKREHGLRRPEDAPYSRVKFLQNKAEWTRKGTCTWCGSLRPDIFLDALEAGAEYGATTKSYKAYLYGPKAPSVGGACKVYFQHFHEHDWKRFREIAESQSL